MTVQRGDALSHYRLIEKIGEGGMGAVWKALDTSLGREVAIKILPEAVAADADRIARLQREARTLASLNHPNIITIHSVEEERGVVFLTMELAKGRPLSRLIPRAGLPLQKIFDIAIPLASGLAAAHEKSVVHRDLKPANVVVADEGGLKILDFGLARLKPAPREGRPGEESTETVTAAGEIAGTFPYMSPEQLRAQPADHRSDIFSLGVILYELAAGARPFVGKTAGEVASSILKDAPAAVNEIRPALPPMMARIVRRCLEKDPAHRYQSAIDVRNDLEDLQKELESAAAKGRETRAVPGRRSRRRLLPAALSVAAGLILLLSVLLPARFRDWFGAGPALRAQSIAVLPLVNLMGDPGQDYFVDGMHDALIGELAKTGLKVISRTTVMRYRKTDKTATQIASELRVDALVEGTVLRVGNQVRVNAQLINGATDEHVWNDSYSRDLANAMALLADVTRQIAAEIKLTLTPRQQQLLGRAGAVKPEAQDAYLMGRSLLNQGSIEGARNSIGHFEKAIELDPQFAPPHSGIAWASTLIAVIQGELGHLANPERSRAMRAHVNKALDLDPDLADAHALAGSISLYLDWDWTHAEKELRLALELNPSDAWVYHPYADCLLVLGRAEESLAFVRKGVERDPYSATVAFPLGPHLVFARHFEESIEESRKFTSLFPDNSLGTGYLREALWHGGRKDEALREYRAGWQREPDLVAALDRGFAEGGAAGALRAVARLLDSRSKSTRVSPLDVARFYALGGDADRALAWLERAYEQRMPFLAHLRADPDYDALRSDPRFRDLLRRMRFPD